MRRAAKIAGGRGAGLKGANARQIALHGAGLRAAQQSLFAEELVACWTYSPNSTSTVSLLPKTILSGSSIICFTATRNLTLSLPSMVPWSGVFCAHSDDEWVLLAKSRLVDRMRMKTAITTPRAVPG